MSSLNYSNIHLEENTNNELFGSAVDSFATSYSLDNCGKCPEARSNTVSLLKYDGDSNNSNSNSNRPRNTVAVSELFICYAVRKSILRIINTITSQKELYKGHASDVQDLQFHRSINNNSNNNGNSSNNNNVNVLCSVDAGEDSSVNHTFIWETVPDNTSLESPYGNVNDPLRLRTLYSSTVRANLVIPHTVHSGTFVIAHTKLGYFGIISSINSNNNSNSSSNSNSNCSNNISNEVNLREELLLYGFYDINKYTITDMAVTPNGNKLIISLASAEGSFLDVYDLTEFNQTINNNNNSNNSSSSKCVTGHYSHRQLIQSTPSTAASTAATANPSTVAGTAAGTVALACMNNYVITAVATTTATQNNATCDITVQVWSAIFSCLQTVQIAVPIWSSSSSSSSYDNNNNNIINSSSYSLSCISHHQGNIIVLSHRSSSYVACLAVTDYSVKDNDTNNAVGTLPIGQVTLVNLKYPILSMGVTVITEQHNHDSYELTSNTNSNNNSTVASPMYHHNSNSNNSIMFSTANAGGGGVGTGGADDINNNHVEIACYQYPCAKDGNAAVMQFHLPILALTNHTTTTITSTNNNKNNNSISNNIDSATDKNTTTISSNTLAATSSTSLITTAPIPATSISTNLLNLIKGTSTATGTVGGIISDVIQDKHLTPLGELNNNNSTLDTNKVNEPPVKLNSIPINSRKVELGSFLLGNKTFNATTDNNTDNNNNNSDNNDNNITVTTTPAPASVTPAPATAAADAVVGGKSVDILELLKSNKTNPFSTAPVAVTASAPANESVVEESAVNNNSNNISLLPSRNNKFPLPTVSSTKAPLKPTPVTATAAATAVPAAVDDAGNSSNDLLFSTSGGSSGVSGGILSMINNARKVKSGSGKGSLLAAGSSNNNSNNDLLSMLNNNSNNNKTADDLLAPVLVKLSNEVDTADSGTIDNNNSNNKNNSTEEDSPTSNAAITTTATAAVSAGIAAVSYNNTNAINTNTIVNANKISKPLLKRPAATATKTVVIPSTIADTFAVNNNNNNNNNNAASNNNSNSNSSSTDNSNKDNATTPNNNSSIGSIDVSTLYSMLNSQSTLITDLTQQQSKLAKELSSLALSTTNNSSNNSSNNSANVANEVTVNLTKLLQEQQAKHTVTIQNSNTEIIKRVTAVVSNEVKKSIDSGLKGPLSDEIAKNVANQLQTQLKTQLSSSLHATLPQAFQKEFAQTIIPAFQAGMNNMLNQLNHSFSSAMGQLMEQHQQGIMQLASYNNNNNNANNNNNNNSDSTIQALQQEVVQLRYQLSSLQSSQKTEHDALVKLIGELRTVVLSNSSANNNNNNNNQYSLNNLIPVDPFVLLQQGKMQEAIAAVLEQKNVHSLVKLLSVIASPAEVTSTVTNKLYLLCTVQQLAADFAFNTPEEGVGSRLEWLKDLLMFCLYTPADDANNNDNNVNGNDESVHDSLYSAISSYLKLAEERFSNLPMKPVQGTSAPTTPLTNNSNQSNSNNSTDSGLLAMYSGCATRSELRDLRMLVAILARY